LLLGFLPLVAVAAASPPEPSPECADHPVRVSALDEETTLPEDAAPGVFGDCSDGRHAIVSTRDPTVRIAVLARRWLPYDFEGMARRKMFSAEELESYAFCRSGRCSCDERIEYPVLSGSSSAIRSINQTWRNQAKQQAHCVDPRRPTDLSRFVHLIPLYVYAGPTFVSTASYQLFESVGANGSCHGEVSFETRDLANGRIYTVADIVPAINAQSLREAVAKAYEVQIRRFMDVRDGAEITKLARRFTAKHQDELSNSGIYVEDGRVFVNISGFDFSCAEGSFHPVELPPALFDRQFNELLGSTSKR
jgi:hypothetical protein